MSEYRAMGSLGLLCGFLAATVLASGCSSAAPGDDGTVPEVQNHGTSAEMILPPQNINVYPSGPLPAYCVYYAPPIYQVFPAHYVEKIPNTWGANYASWNGRNFDDGYSIPFPTPWVAPTATTPDPYAYEHALWNIPSTLFWEYLVHDITPPASPDHPYTENVGRAYFMVGIPALSDYSAAANLASANTAYPVESRVNKCVRIVTRSGSTITDTGEYFLVYDEHDPRTPPT